MRWFVFLMLPCVLYSGVYTTPELDELRIELEDLKHALRTTQVDLNLLDERLKKPAHQNKDSGLSALEKKVTHLEKTLEKVAQDLRTLNNAATQQLAKIQNLESEISSHEKQLEEVGKLKGTLTSISKAISPRSSAATKSYRVKAGDSLEKIARKYGTSAETIRKLNNLPNDKIVIGQELKVPDEPN
jgi:LysM repeat protein